MLLNEQFVDIAFLKISALKKMEGKTAYKLENC